MNRKYMRNLLDIWAEIDTSPVLYIDSNAKSLRVKRTPCMDDSPSRVVSRATFGVRTSIHYKTSLRLLIFGHLRSQSKQNRHYVSPPLTNQMDFFLKLPTVFSNEELAKIFNDVPTDKEGNGGSSGGGCVIT